MRAHVAGNSFRGDLYDRQGGTTAVHPWHAVDLGAFSTMSEMVDQARGSDPLSALRALLQ